jgi:uncharacterized membrane protein
MAYPPLYVACALCAIAAVAERLGRTAIGRRIGGAIIALILGIVLSNLGVIPDATQQPPLYAQLVMVGAPAAIFLLLLDVHLAALRRAGPAMLTAFAIGAVATMCGVAAAFWLTDARDALGGFAAPVGGMYAATYIGGSANLAAIGLHYGVVNDAALFAAVNAVDAVAGTVWLASLVVIATTVRAVSGTAPAGPSAPEPEPDVADAREITVGGIAALIAMALGGLWLSQECSAWLATRGIGVPAILILTTLALAVAQVPAMRRVGGARLLGIAVSYLFIAVVGAHCDFDALVGLGATGGALLAFATTVLLVHGVILFGLGRLLRLHPDTLAVASSANIGGATTIMPIAGGLGRMDLLGPGIVAGSLGNALGTYAGFLVVYLLNG